MTRIICTEEIPIHSIENKSCTELEAYTACRLIPLDKKPGVRPIGIGEVLRSIVGKAILSILKPEILESAGSPQLCAGQPAGCEAATHAMNDIFDASNAYNALNRAVVAQYKTFMSLNGYIYT